MSYQGADPKQLVRENAIVKCSQSNDEIKMIFPEPPLGQMGGENNDVKQMLDAYTIKAGEQGACFDKVFDQCNKATDEDQTCTFSVVDVWQRVSTVEYITTSGDMERFHVLMQSIQEDIRTLKSEMDKTRSSNAKPSLTDRYTYISALFLAFEEEKMGNFSATPENVVEAHKFLNNAKKVSQNIQEYKQGGLLGSLKQNNTDTIDKINKEITEAREILILITKNNYSESPRGSFPLLMESELPCFKLGYLYFKENGKIEGEIEEEVIEPTPIPSRLPNNRLQNRSNWCYATASLRWATESGRITAEHRDGIANYEPVKIKDLSTVTFNYRDYSGDYLGYNAEEDYYYCDSGQEYVVNLVKKNPENDDGGSVEIAMERLTGTKPSRISTAGKTTNDFANIQIPFILHAQDGDEGHALYGTGITTEADGTTALHAFDPMTGYEVVVTDLAARQKVETFNSGKADIIYVYYYE